MPTWRRTTPSSGTCSPKHPFDTDQQNNLGEGKPRRAKRAREKKKQMQDGGQVFAAASMFHCDLCGQLSGLNCVAVTPAAIEVNMFSQVDDHKLMPMSLRFPCMSCHAQDILGKGWHKTRLDKTIFLSPHRTVEGVEPPCVVICPSTPTPTTPVLSLHR